MPLIPERLWSWKQRWRDGPVSCFTWPSFEATQVLLTTDTVGEDVAEEHKNPRWRDMIRKAQNATTAFKASEDSVSFTPGFLLLGKWCPASQRFGWYQYDGDLAIGHSTVWDKPTSPTTSLHAKTRDEALVRAVSDARSKQTHFRGGNFLAELADAYRGLRNPAKGFRDLLDTYSRNARKRVKRACGRRAIPVSQNDFRRLERDKPDVARAAQRALSDTWLEHNFGWQPLLSDATDAYLAIRRLAARVPTSAFHGFSENMDAPTYISNYRLHDVTQVKWTARTQFAYDCRVYGAVKIEVDEPPWRQGVEEMGVRARDFIPAVWEAIPYSWLVDYFTDIGDILEAVTFPRSDLAWVSMTYRNHSIRSTEQCVVNPDFITSPFPADGSNKVFGFRPFRVEWRRKYVSRSVYGGSLCPTFRFEIPGRKNWRKWLNIAALARLRSL